MLLVLSTLYGAYGGIPAFNRLLVQAAADFCLRLRQPLVVLALTDASADVPAVRSVEGASRAAMQPGVHPSAPPRGPVGDLPAGVTYRAFAGDRRALLAAYLQQVGRPLPLIVGHVNLAPLGLIWPGPVGVLAHGSEVYARLPALRRWALLRATRIAAVSDHTRRCLIDVQGLPAARCVRVVNALPSLPIVPPPSDATTGLRLLCISRLHPDEPKGVDVLLRALARLPESAASLTVIGDGAARPALQALAQDLGLADSRVRFLGPVPDSVRDAELSACDVFVLPSESEGFGIVYLEALARGKPCIAAQAGGAPEIVVPEQTGLVIPVPAAAHVADLSAAIVRLSDPGLRARLGAAGRRRVLQDHSATAFAQRAQAFFAALRGRAPVAGPEI